MGVDKKIYPPNWDQIRQVILRRAGRCCESCGIKQYSVLRRVGEWRCVYKVGFDNREGQRLKLEAFEKFNRKFVCIRLQVAHLDHDEWNHDVKFSRLKALCERCHLDYDRPDNEKRKKYGTQYKRWQLSIDVSV